MPLPKITDIRKLSDEEISNEIVETKKQLFQLRLQQATGREVKTHQFKRFRHRLGQLMTIETERKLGLNSTKVEDNKEE